MEFGPLALTAVLMVPCPVILAYCKNINLIYSYTYINVSLQNNESIYVAKILYLMTVPNHTLKLIKLWKTNNLHTKTEVHFLPVHYRYTHTLFKY